MNEKMLEKIAVLGTGRSGTNFFAAVLAELGRDVQHEKMGADGIASWCLVADVESAVYGPGGAVLDSSFVVGHQVRNPLKAIGSLTTFNKSSWKYISENSPNLPRNITHRAMKHWLDWNIRAAERSSFTWQLETLENAQPKILNRLGWGVSNKEWQEAYARARHGANTGAARATTSLLNPKVGPVTQWRRLKYNNRKHPLSWGELEKIDTGLATEIKDFSYALGYNISSSES
jgi:hypothetical protein